MLQKTVSPPPATIVYENCPLCGSKKIEPKLATKDFSISGEAFDICSCKDCTFTFTQNIPTPGTIAPYYQSEVYISHSDTRKGLINKLYHFARELMLKRKRKLIEKLADGKTLLDVGSGTGYFLNHMKQNNFNVKGIEIDEAARSATLKNFNIPVHEPGFLLNKKFDHKVDIITLWHVLEHLHELDRYMESMYDVLKKDGYLLIAVPNYTAYDARYYGKYWAAYDVPRHLWHFSPKTIAKLAYKHGFEVVDQKKLPLDPFYNALLSEKYKSSKLSLIFGSIIGLISFVMGIFNPRQITSPIYILKKKAT